MYSFDEIKMVSNCLEFAKSKLGLIEVSEGRFNCPWGHDKDSGSLAINEKGWFYHVEKTKGSIIDLLAKIRFSGDIFSASEFLGNFYHLEPTTTPVKISPAKTMREIVETYDYRDTDNVLLYQVVRYSPKDFRQRQPKNGVWTWNLKGVKKVLYRMPDWMHSDYVCIVEGEKDANALFDLTIPATTCAGGSGKWIDSYSNYIKGKKIVIFSDNDAAGVKHSISIANSIFENAKSIKIITPSTKEKGDIADFINDHNKKINDGVETDSVNIAIKKLVEKASFWMPDLKKIAIEANEFPFSNFKTVIQKVGKSEKTYKESIDMNVLVRDVLRRFQGFPCRIGSSLFDHDHDNNRIRIFSNIDGLFAWINEKSCKQVNWSARAEGLATKGELYEALSANAMIYNSISNIPSYPKRSDVYYSHSTLPNPTDDGRYFNRFCSFFCPSSEVDSALIKVLVASCLYYRKESKKPLFIIDSDHGQAVGKTTLVEKIAQLLGGSDSEGGTTISVQFKQLQNDTQQERIIKRILSESGRRKRILLIDNVTGNFDCPELAEMITTPYITGLAPYGRGEESRPNDLTYILTSNTATVKTDLASRAFYIYLQRPEKIANWEVKINEFIAKNRMNIIADAVYLLEKNKVQNLIPVTRFGPWEKDVLVPIINNTDLYSEVFKTNQTRQKTSDLDVEESDLIRERFISGIESVCLDAENDSCFIHSEVAISWVKEAIETHDRSSTIMQNLRNYSKNDSIKELSFRPQIYPSHGKNRKRGICWNWDLKEENQQKMIIGYDNEQKTEVKNDLF